MSDHIALSPAQAGQTLLGVQNTLKSYLSEINTLGELARAFCAITWSNPIAVAIEAMAKALTEIGMACNAAVNSYSLAFVDVVHAWKQSDATAASAVSFSKPAFDGVFVNPNTPDKVEVLPPRFRNLIEQHNDHTSRMTQLFNSMSDEILNSASYWIGESGDKTRATWRSKVLPLESEVTKLMHKLAEMLGAELTGILSRDANTYVS